MKNLSNEFIKRELAVQFHLHVNSL